MSRTFRRPILIPFKVPRKTFGTVDAVWWYFGMLSVSSQCCGLMYAIPRDKGRLKIDPRLCFLGTTIVMAFHALLLVYLSFICKYARYRCFGRAVKLVIEVVTLSLTIALREIVEYNLACLVLFMGIIADAYIVARILHLAYDVSAWEIVLALLLQPLVYFAGGNRYILLVVCMFCGAITFYRFVTYKTPVMPVDPKKEESEELSC